MQGTGKQRLARELPTKRRRAEVSVLPLAALVSSAGTILIAKADIGSHCGCCLQPPIGRACGCGRGRTKEIFTKENIDE